YFVYLFVLSYKEIKAQKKKIKKYSLLNQKMLIHFSNELRAPLPVIRDFIELLYLEKAGQLNEKQKKILNLLHKNTEELIEESSSLVYYNQLKTGELYLNKQNLNLIELVNDAIRRCDDELLNRKIKIRYRPRKKKIPILADKGKLLSAIYAVLRNITLMAKSSSSIKVWSRQSKYSNYLQIIFIYQGKMFPEPELFSQSIIDIFVANKIITLHGGNMSRKTQDDQKQKITIILPSNN
ncbi:MAG: hypothetical protein NT039_03845, partial [Candidatus Berkelbacteria bacterium]|nr:hypothetical protein [Candidatus Berkelbacteria bacterium]